jgi:hypothetical protein
VGRAPAAAILKKPREPSFSRRVRARVLPKQKERAPPRKREAERRKAHHPLSAPHREVLPLACARARKRIRRDALASRRSTAALVTATERFDSTQAVLHAMKMQRHYLRVWIALKRCTPRAGRNAGGNDARTARERGYKPRPREPHSLHQSAVTGDVPEVSEIQRSYLKEGPMSRGFITFGDGAQPANFGHGKSQGGGLRFQLIGPTDCHCNSLSALSEWSWPDLSRPSRFCFGGGIKDVDARHIGERSDAAFERLWPGMTAEEL